MDIGILKENKGSRVLITPSTAKSLIKNGNNVFFTIDCGIESGFKNEEYISVGCILQDTNLDTINNSKLITIFKLPEKSLIKSISNKIIIAYTEAVSNFAEIELLSKNKNTLIGIEFIERKPNEFYIEDQINKIIAHIGFNIINYKFNFPENSLSGDLLSKFGFSSKKSISIIGYNSLSKEIINLLKNKNVEIFIYSEIDKLINEENVNNINDLNIFNIDKIDKIKKSDIIINTLKNKFKYNEVILDKKFIEEIKDGVLFFDLCINYGKISPALRETNFNDLSYKYKNKHFFCPQDITKCNGKTLSNLISHHLFHYLNLIIDNDLTNEYFKSAILIKEGVINNNIVFLKESNINIINDPFDLMETEFSDYFEDEELEDLNDKFNEIDDYEIIN